MSSKNQQLQKNNPAGFCLSIFFASFDGQSLWLMVKENGRSFRTLGLMLEKKQSPPAG